MPILNRRYFENDELFQQVLAFLTTAEPLAAMTKRWRREYRLTASTDNNNFTVAVLAPNPATARYAQLVGRSFKFGSDVLEVVRGISEALEDHFALRESDDEKHFKLNLKKLELGCDSYNVKEVASLSPYFDAEKVSRRKIGITPGRRLYEVLDTPFGRNVTLWSGRELTNAHQKSPFRSKIKANFNALTVGSNIPARSTKGPRSRAQKYASVWTIPSRCMVLTNLASQIPDDTLRSLFLERLEGTYAPEKRELRLRKVANWAVRNTTNLDLEVTKENFRSVAKEMAQAGYPEVKSIIRDAFTVSEIDTSLRRARSIGYSLHRLFKSDELAWLNLIMKLDECL